MYQPKLYLRFEPPIKNDTVGIDQLDKILGLIENEYSSVYWWLGQYPTEYNPFNDEGEDIADQVKCLTIGHWPDSPNRLTYGQWDDNDENYQNAIDGWQWLKDRDVDYDQTSDIFSSLNESEEEIPKVTYVFEPPIEDEETLRNVLYVIGIEHPGVMWPGFVGDVTTNKPILNNSIYREIFVDNEGYDFVGGLIIHPGKDFDIITWTSWVDPQGGYSDYGPKVDGWQLVNKHSIPNTEDVFNQLNESVSNDIQVGDFIIVKDYQQLHKSLTSALYLQPDKKYKIIEIIPNFGVTFINNFGAKHSLKFETIDKFFYVLKPNDFSGTEDVFDQLNESTYQPKLNLRFEEPIYVANQLDKVLRVLDVVYPGLQWKGGDSIKTHNVIRDGDGEDDFLYDPIYYLTIGFFSTSPNRLTYTNGPDDDPSYADDEHHGFNWVDGWQWVKDNEVNYDETTDIFNQLNESYDFLGQTNLKGFKFRKTIDNNPKLWVVRTVINDDGKELYFKYDFSDAAKELLGSPGLYGDDLPSYGDMEKEKVINLANEGDWEIIDMPTTETEDAFNQLNESKVNIPELNPETTFVFKPKIEDAETMKKILMTFQIYYPNLTWVNHKKLIDYNPFNHEPETKDGVYYLGFTTDRQLKEVVMVWGSEEEYHSVYLSDCRRCGGIGYNKETGEDCELCDTTGVADFNNTGNYNGWDFVDRIDGLKTFDTEKLFD